MRTGTVLRTPSDCCSTARTLSIFSSKLVNYNSHCSGKKIDALNASVGDVMYECAAAAEVDGVIARASLNHIITRP